MRLQPPFLFYFFQGCRKVDITENEPISKQHLPQKSKTDILDSTNLGMLSFLVDWERNAVRLGAFIKSAFWAAADGATCLIE